MKHRESTTIQPGELTEHRGNLYVAARLSPSKPCDEQCAMAGADGCAVCNGYCWRWANGDGIVFRFATPDIEPIKCTAVQTPDLIGMKLQGDLDDGKRKAELKYQARKGKRSMGGVYAYGKKYRAEIGFKGVRYHSPNMSREEAQQWLEDFKREKGLSQ